MVNAVRFEEVLRLRNFLSHSILITWDSRNFVGCKWLWQVDLPIRWLDNCNKMFMQKLTLFFMIFPRRMIAT